MTASTFGNFARPELSMPHKEESRSADQDDFEEQERTQRLRVKNRRKLYLDSHPSYFTNADLELQGMLLIEKFFEEDAAY